MAIINLIKVILMEVNGYIDYIVTMNFIFHQISVIHYHNLCY